MLSDDFRDDRFAVVFNAAAGSGRARLLLPKLKLAIGSFVRTAQWIEASECESAVRELKSAFARGARNFVVVGGDGTIHTVINTLPLGEYRIGIVPVGGGNDFAAALQIPTNPIAAARSIHTSRLRRVDLVQVCAAGGITRVYAGGGGVGLDVEAARLARERYSQWPGRLRYLAAALHGAVQSAGVKIGLEFPGTAIPTTSATALTVAVMNTPSFGSGLRLAPKAKVDDGLLDVAVVAYRSIGKLLPLVPRMAISGTLPERMIERQRVACVRICAVTPRMFQGDGEEIGQTPLELRALPEALCVLAGDGN